MLYPKNTEKQLCKELFKNPTSEYRGAPFWAWNSKLNKDLLIKEIGYLKEMGMGGFHIHCRSGMATEYLGNEFMDLVKTCNDKAKENDMLCWLYDEDRWPSGAAGGLVTREEKYRSRFLVFTPKPNSGIISEDSIHDSSARAQRSNNRKCLGIYEVILENGYLAYYRKLGDGEEPKAGAKIWYAYLEVAGNSPWFNNQAYVNTLDKEAIKKFVEITHERYFEAVGGEFGKSIPAIFTDEPQFSHKETLGFAEEEKEVILPFTDDFEETYKNTYGDSILEKLPELFWELPRGEVSLTRYRYHDHVSECFTSSFADIIGNWCKEHGIMLTGHMMEEPTLSSQTRALGEAMRSYRSFQLPGIDMLCDFREYTTAKQAQSAAHQYGSPGVLSELYGVTNWDFDFRGHKLQGDWQAALGVTVRVHHLAWVSMNGEAKRDYPASIGYQSPWYKEYALIENHFARVNTAMTRGKAHIKVGVIHPIESYWLHFGPEEQTAIICEEMENNFKNITEWLLFGLIDFDFISEALLPSQCKVEEMAPIRVGEMAYDVILVPGCETLRESTIERLEAFNNAGGRVVFLGEPASLVNARKSNRVQALVKNCVCIPFARTKLMETLQEYRDIDIRKENSSRTDGLIYQMREDGDRRWLFICHAKKMSNPDIASMERISIRVKGRWRPVVYETLTGEINTCAARVYKGETWITHEFSQHDSLLLCLETGEPEASYEVHEDKPGINKEIYLDSPVPVTLSEPNVLLLDLAEYSFNKGPWYPREEVLRIDNEFRKKLGYPLRMEALAQPWVNPAVEEPVNLLSLKFSIDSEIEVENSYLALEGAENTEIIVNGTRVESIIEGFFVDECINKVKLPPMAKGKSEIILNIPFASKTNVEWCYLLGNFGVKIEGSRAKIIEPVQTLTFGSWVNQGLPFYAGNVTYNCSMECKDGELQLEASHYRNTLLSVALDGEEKGKLVFAPYKLKLGRVSKGKHSIDITAYGNRVNAFGAVHNCSRSTTWFGPSAWRSEGNCWSYEYQLKEMGILISPKVRVE